MAGWENNADIYVESVEEILDTNPDLYKQRTIAALNENRYNDALKEVDLALYYGNRDMQYRVLKVRVLLEMKSYRNCYLYLKESGLLDIIYKEKNIDELLPDEINYVYYSYGVCKGQLVINETRENIVIVTPDGKGVYKTIQQAIDKCNSSQKIYITNGNYQEDINITNQTINIIGTVYGNEKGQESVIHGSIKVKNSKVKIDNITFCMGVCTENTIIDIEKSKVIMNNNRISGDSTVAGIYSHQSSDITLRECRVKSCQEGILTGSGDGRLNIYGGIFEKCRMGIFTQEWTYINGACFKQNKEIGVGVLAKNITNEYNTIIENCEIVDNVGGVAISKANVFINNSILYHNRINLTIMNTGKSYILKTTIKAAKIAAFGAYNNPDFKGVNQGTLELEDCIIEGNCKEYKKDFEIFVKEKNVTRKNNDEISSYVEGAKKFFKTWL